jgi:sugar phosphate isomerase/epimerase
MARAISLAALTVLDVSPLDAARIAARVGYSHIGLRCVPATPDEAHAPILSDARLRRDLRNLIEGEGLRVLDTEIVRIKPEMDWDALSGVLSFSQEFCASRLLVADNDPEPGRCRDSLAKLAGIARQYDVTPHLEFMPWTCSPDLRTAQNRIADIDNCALLIDAFHLVRSGGTISDVTLRDPSVGYLQLCDIAGPIPALNEILREARADRLFPGEGDIDLVGLLQKFPDIPISLEIPADRLRDTGWTAEARAKRAFDTALSVLKVADAHA